MRSPDAYGKMTEMSSGRNFQCGIDSRGTSFTGSSMASCKLTEDSVEFIDDREEKNTGEELKDALYNFPWDFKNKTSQLILQTSITEASKQNSFKSQVSQNKIPPPPPQCPPPSTANSTLQINNKIEEDEYCAPWDLKLQEEMFKKMSEQKKDSAIASSSTSSTNTNTTKSSNSPNSEVESINSNTNGLSTIASEKSNNPMNDSTPRQSIQQNSIEESNEYSPPWELKQSILMQTINSQNNNNQNSVTRSTATSMPAPLCTSSTTSTLTNATNQQNTSALASLFNQFSRTRLSTRSNTSSSSSTRSSTSSLSASSPPSIPPPPLPPSIPPPPPPSSFPTSVNRCNSLSSNNNQHIQQSPHLAHRHLGQTNSSSNLIPGSSNNSNNSLLMSRNVSGGLINGNSCNTCSMKNALLMNSTNSTYLSESANNKFCSWGTNSSNSSNTNSFDTNNFISDESKSSFSKPNRSSNQNFVYPSMINNFQTAQLGGQQIMNIDTSTLNNKTFQIGGIPVTALVFQQTCGSLPANFVPLNMQHQQQVISPTSLSHLRLLERQVWFHGKITRKKAETVLENRAIGSFLIRQSESGNANDFSLSLVGSGVVHMRISMKNGEYILGQCSQPFNSIVKMVEHYGKVEVPIKGALHVRLTNPVSIK